MYNTIKFAWLGIQNSYYVTGKWSGNLGKFHCFKHSNSDNFKGHRNPQTKWTKSNLVKVLYLLHLSEFSHLPLRSPFATFENKESRTDFVCLNADLKTIFLTARVQKRVKATFTLTKVALDLHNTCNFILFLHKFCIISVTSLCYSMADKWPWTSNYISVNVNKT